MNEAQAKAWEAAQALPISVDLVAAANEELRMLEEVDRLQCLYEGPAVKRAIDRYERFWLPLLAREGDENLLPLIPPLDCAWIWHVHRLNPIRYSNDCKELYGRILDAPIVKSSERSAAVERTQEFWSTLFVGEPYNIQFGHPENKPAQEEESSGIASSHKELQVPIDFKKITYDLEAAVFRQKTFFYQVSCKACWRRLIFLSIVT